MSGDRGCSSRLSGRWHRCRRRTLASGRHWPPGCRPSAWRLPQPRPVRGRHYRHPGRRRTRPARWEQDGQGTCRAFPRRVRPTPRPGWSRPADRPRWSRHRVRGGGVGSRRLRLDRCHWRTLHRSQQHLRHVDDLDLVACLPGCLLGGQAVGEHHPAEGAADRDLVGIRRDCLGGAVDVDPLPAKVRLEDGAALLTCALRWSG